VSIATRTALGDTEAVKATRRPLILRSAISQRRWRAFNGNRRAKWSLWIFLSMFAFTGIAEVVVNDKPIVVSYNGELLFPALVTYPESKFGGFLAVTDYRKPFIQREINENGWMLWPAIRYANNTFDRNLPTPNPSPPSWTMSKEERCRNFPGGVDDPNCTVGNFHWLGTDDQGRDVLSRVIYGFRISVTFGFLLTIFSSVIGVIVGAVQGYFGGWVDLIGQRLLELWGSIPTLYIIIIVFSFIYPSFWTVLLVMLVFSWATLTGIVRAEFLRARNFEYVTAARALGISNISIMYRHLLPNAMVATLTLMPFILAGSVGTLASLDFLGYGLPAGSASLGEMVLQAKDNIWAIWLGFTAFFSIAIMLTLLIFIGEGVRDAFDPRKTFGGSRA
jgi:microcin C transport system permease protein